MSLHAWTWSRVSPRGAVALVHGAGEYCGRYEHVAARLNAAGYAVLGLDLPGMGLSPGRRGHVEHFDDYLGVVDETLQGLANLHPDVPRFLYGHSMGGLIAVRWLQVRRPATETLGGVVLSSPCLDLSLAIPPSLLRAGAALERIWPTMPQSTRIPSNAVSRHPDVVARYGSDPLVLHRVTVRWAMELQRAMQAAREGDAAFPVPTLVLQAGADRIVSAAATRDFAAQLQAPVKSYREFDGLYHELHNEPERDEVLGEIVAFLDSRSGHAAQD